MRLILIFVTCFQSISYQLEDFACLKDYSIVDRPTDPFQKETKIFGRKCGCKDDWKETFCENQEKYSKMRPNQAPHACICRQLGENDGSCEQFMTRCFRERSTGYKTCKCCFNQPDIHCNQIDCKDMSPDFGRGMNTSCICHDQTNYPVDICAREDRHGLRKTPPALDLPSVRSSGTEVKNSTSKPGGKTVFYTAIWQHIKDNKLALIFVSILFFGLLAAIIFACSVLCFGKAKTTKRTRSKRQSRMDTERKLLEIANNQDPDQYLP
uniref:Uncharacterized protein n=1 Tax=Panagrolaimus sp. JU765 TaxID=591449 RepID=A0AC34QTW5_9BILA